MDIYLWTNIMSRSCVNYKNLSEAFSVSWIYFIRLLYFFFNTFTFFSFLTFFFFFYLNLYSLALYLLTFVVTKIVLEMFTTIEIFTSIKNYFFVLFPSKCTASQALIFLCKLSIISR